MHYRCLTAKVGCVSGLQTKKSLFVWHSAQLALPLPDGEGRLRFGIANKKNLFLFGTPLNLHYRCLTAKVGCVSGLQTKKISFCLALRSTCTTFAPLFKKQRSGCSAVRLARLLWEQEVPGSNPGTPTTKPPHLPTTESKSLVVGFFVGWEDGRTGLAGGV